MKKYILATILTIALTLPAWAVKNVPDGFNGIKWGTKPDQVKGLVYSESDDNATFYTKTADKATLGGVTFTDITYMFANDKGLYAIAALDKGKANHQKLEKYARSQYGKPDDESTPNVLVWEDENISITLQYFPESEELFLGIGSIATIVN